MYIIVIGCGSLGRTLVEHLTAEDNEVVIVEKNEQKAKKFAEELDALVIHGDGSDGNILKDAGIERADAVAVLTEDDNANLTICQMVKKFDVPRIIARVNDPTKEELFLGLDITAAISPNNVIVSYFKNAITQKGKSVVSIAKGKAEIIELTANEKLDNKKIKDITLPSGAIIGIICRNGEVIIPHQEEKLKKDDLLIVITKTEVSKDVLTMLK